MDLRIDADDLNACVQCGLCLPHCPTYRVTGDEALSPRGRIHLMREVQDNAAPVTPEVVDAFDTCVQCRGCEPACPSGVPYGRLIESTRAVLADMGAVYVGSALVLGAVFLGLAIRVWRRPEPALAMRLFGWSITYVTLLFAAMAVDEVVRHGI